MSRTIETTSTPDLLIQAEPRTKGRRERDVCRKLVSKVAVITGDSTGMCLATAKRFVQVGMDRVFITGRRKDALDGAEFRATSRAGTTLIACNQSVKAYARKLDVVFADAGVHSWRRSVLWTRNHLGCRTPRKPYSRERNQPWLYQYSDFRDGLTKMKEELAKNVPLGRLGDPYEIAKAVAFLASDEASYIAGIDLTVHRRGSNMIMPADCQGGFDSFDTGAEP
jgi:NAD(P)-dependent dehydrogenase (short-subunit alcohol dehydrogenase family)